jgi:predicted nucleotidyltransferase
MFEERLDKSDRPVTALLAAMTDRIVRDFQPVRILLFGSHARGEAGPESDVDLLVVLPEVADKRQAAVEIRRALRAFPVCKDIIVTTPEEITRRGDLVGTVLRPALREGKVLYERS